MTFPGSTKFASFLDENRISRRQAGRDLSVSAPTVLDWISGSRRPDENNRKAIRVYTRGVVVEADWETDKDREAAQRVADVKPFEPKSEAHESGELPAVVADGTGTEGDG